MADSELRQLERSFRELGTIEAETAWLKARLQAGAVDQGSLELAAYCGSRAARQLVPSAPTAPKRPLLFVRGFEADRDWGNVVRSRAGLAIANLALERWFVLLPDDRFMASAQDTLERWTLGERVEISALRDISWRIREALNEQFVRGAVNPFTGVPGLSVAKASGRPLWRTYLTVLRGLERDYVPQPTKGLTEAAFLASRLQEWFHGKDEAEAKRVVAERVRSEIMPWALGYSDVVAERIEARKADCGARSPEVE